MVDSVLNLFPFTSYSWDEIISCAKTQVLDEGRSEAQRQFGRDLYLQVVTPHHDNFDPTFLSPKLLASSQVC